MDRRALIAALVGAALGVVSAVLLVWSLWPDHSVEAVSKLKVDLSVLQAEVERLKKVVPDQAHAMADVDYHFTNLWFAGQARNWPLADFYWKETLSHMRWAIRIIPIRKDSAGRDVNVQGILESFETSTLKELSDSIEAQDQGRFEDKYKLLVETCYTCHTTAEKPFLRPQVPEQRATGIINFDPGATWPK